MTSEQESSSSNNLSKKLENELKKRGQKIQTLSLKSAKAKGWDKEPLSILWCLKSFNSSNDDENSTQSRVILYDAKTVMAVEKLPSENPENNSKKKKKKKRKRNRNSPKRKRFSRRDFQEDPCESCESIESSPTRYKDDTTWTGYKLKRRGLRRINLENDDGPDTE